MKPVLISSFLSLFPVVLTGTIVAIMGLMTATLSKIGPRDCAFAVARQTERPQRAKKPDVSSGHSLSLRV